MLLLVTLRPGTTTASSKELCDTQLDAAEVAGETDAARDALLEDRFVSVIIRMEALERRMVCAEEPIPDYLLARVFYLQTFALWMARDEDEAERRLAYMFAIFKEYEWDSELARRTGQRERVRDFKRIRNILLRQTPPARYTIGKKRADDVAYVDGNRLPPNLTSVGTEIPSGRHFVQFKDGQGAWSAYWIDLPPYADDPIELSPRGPPGFSEAIAAVAGEVLWLPGNGLELSEGDIGLRVSLGMTRDRTLAELWLGLYPARIPGGIGRDAANTYGESLPDGTLPVVRAGGTLGIGRFRGAGARIGVGLSAGLLSVPFVMTSCESSECTGATLQEKTSASRADSPTTTPSPPGARVVLAQSIGGFASIRWTYTRDLEGFTFLAGLEGGYAAVTANLGDTVYANPLMLSPILGACLDLRYSW